MTKEDKELLLKDLCARLPYEVKLDTPDGLDTLGNIDINEGWINASYDVDEVKPYLRSMDDMTEEEEFALDETRCYTQLTLESYDWLNKHHFDYRHLIEKGLALEAPKGMYNLDK